MGKSKVRILVDFFIGKLFMKYTYTIAYRRKNDKAFRVIMPTNRFSYADPFVVEYRGKVAFFVELMDYRYGWGTIGVFDMNKNNEVSKVREIIREPYHMSFPNVFEHNGELYMIPETYSSDDVHMYHCISFPDKWEKLSSMIKGVHLVDHAVLERNGTTYVVSYDIDREQSRVFRLDWEKNKLKEFFPKGNFCKERPGGTFFVKDGKLRRVIQDCHKCYGDFIRIYDVKTINRERFDEKEIMTVKTCNLKFDCKNKFEHVHQYSVSSNYEVIDLFYKKFYINKLIHYLFLLVIHPGRKFC